MAHYNQMNIVKDCCAMLSHASSDEEKIAALLFAVQHVQNDECDSRCKALLFKSIGSDFLCRMLLGRLQISDSQDCPRELYRSTALTIITGFCVDPELACNTDMHKFIPFILQIVEESPRGDPIVEDCCQYLKCIIQSIDGRHSLISNGAIRRFGVLYFKLKSDEILELILMLAEAPNISIWDNNMESFNSVMSTISNEFDATNSSRKFKLCSSIRSLVYSLKRELGPAELVNQKWPKTVLKGLRDILTSRIDDPQRDPALKLSCAMVEKFGTSWAILEEIDKIRQFQLILFHLSSIEVRMQLEDQTLDQMLQKCDLIVCCFTILEKFLSDTLELKEKDQIIESFNEAINAVLSAIKMVSTSPTSTVKTPNENFFIYAMIRFLAFGLSHDVLRLDRNVYETMPFIFDIAKDSFSNYRKWFEENFNPESKFGVYPSQPANILVVLLPPLRRFSVEKDGRELILSHLDLYIDCLNFHWSVLEQELNYFEGDSKQPLKNTEPQQTSKIALVSLMELLIDALVMETEDTIQHLPQFSLVFSFIVKMLPGVEGFHMRSLLATASVLGLLCIKHHVVVPIEGDTVVLSVIQTSTLFLRPYFKVRTTDGSVFVTASETMKHWVDIKELWYLGMFTLRGLVESLPWIKPDVEKGLGTEIMEYLTSDKNIEIPQLSV